MNGFALLDVLLVLVLAGYLVQGALRGLLRTASGTIGVIAGTVAAVVAAPFVAVWIPSAPWRLPAVLAAVFLLVFAGYALGAAVGRSLGRRVDRGPLRVVDRVLGAIVNLIVGGLVLSLLAITIGSFGFPGLSQAIASSHVLRAIDGITPDPVKSGLARLRSLAIDDGIPRIVEALQDPPTPPAIPRVDTGDPALTAAAGSVVRIAGNALACSQTQSGSGAVVADDRVLTNAHVVAGVERPVVEVPGGNAITATVVAFDPDHDLALLDVPGITAAPLTLADDLAPGSDAIVDGYPHGGPFTTSPARVLTVGPVRIDDIYGSSPAVREVYTLAADIEQGNSGGPLLTTDGRMAGIVFAKSTNTANVGYAMTSSQIAELVHDAPRLRTRVAPGHCIAEGGTITQG